MAGSGPGGERLADEREFEWDEDKDQINQRKHGIALEIAAQAFSNPNVFEFADDTTDELRYNMLGFVGDRLLRVTFTLRGVTCRIISARKANRHE